MTSTHSGVVAAELQSSSVEQPTYTSATIPNAATAEEKQEPKINWLTALKARPKSVEGEGYPGSDSCSDSDNSTVADDVAETPNLPLPSNSTDEVMSWRTAAYMAISGAPGEVQHAEDQSKDNLETFKPSPQLLDSSPPVTPIKFKFGVQTVISSTNSPAAFKSPSTPTTSWVVSPLRSPIRKRTYEDLSENENASPITLAKRVRRRVFEDGEGVNPALILAPLPQPDEARQSRKTAKRRAANKAKRPATRKTKKVTFGCGAGEGSHEEKGSQDESNASSGSRYAAPHQHAVEEVGAGAVHVYPELEHAALYGNDQFTPGEREEDVSAADQSLAGPSSSIPKLTDADILVICQDTQLQADGTFHCAVFWGCDRTFTYKSALKRHLKEVHGTVRALCDKCGVELSRNDKFTRDRHRCRVSDSQAL